MVDNPQKLRRLPKQLKSGGIKKMAKKVFAWSPVRKLMKDNGAEMVARDAVDALIDYLEKLAKGMTNKALEMTRHAGRKKLTLGDMDLAMTIV